MAWYRKTNTGWNQISNMYRRTNDLETADLISGRYTDSSRAWRRIKAAYRFTGSTWVKVFSKLAGQPYATTAPSLSYDNYLSGGGTDITSNYVLMGPKNTSLSNTIAQSNTGTTYLWGNNGVWDNDTSATIAATFIYNYTNNSSSASNVLNDEGNYSGDKLRNQSGIIDSYDEAYVWYKIAKTSPTGSTGTAYSNSVQILKQPPSISFFASSGTSGTNPGSYAEFTFGVSSLWYDSADLYKSYISWYLLDSSTQTPSSSNLVQTNYLYTAYGTGTFSYFIPSTAVGKFLYVVLKVVNSYNDRSISNAPGPDVTLARGPYELTANIPAGADNTAEFSRDSQNNYNYSVTSVGTWTNSPTSYRYQWYRRVYSSPSVFTWSPISGAINSTFDASSYKLGEIIPVIWASNAAGESDFFLTGFGLRDSGGNDIGSSAGGITPPARLAVYYKAPAISTFIIDASTAAKFTPTFTYTADDPTVTSSLSWSGSASGSLSSVTSGTQYSLSGGTYNFVLKIQNEATNGNSYFSTSSTNATISSPPAAPGTPSGVYLSRNEAAWDGISWTWSASWNAPTSGGPVTYYEAYRQVGTGTVGAASLSTITNTSTPQTNLTSTGTTFSTTVRTAPRADAYVRACNATGCSAYVSGNVG